MAETTDKSFYSCLDVMSIRIVPQAIQHIVIGDFAKLLGGRIVFYTIEDPYTTPSQEVLQEKLKENPSVDGILFYQLAQFGYSGTPNFSLMKKILSQGYPLHFARERISVTDASSLENVFRLASVVSHETSRVFSEFEPLLKVFRDGR